MSVPTPGGLTSRRRNARAPSHCHRTRRSGLKPTRWHARLPQSMRPHVTPSLTRSVAWLGSSERSADSEGEQVLAQPTEDVRRGGANGRARTQRMQQERARPRRRGSNERRPEGRDEGRPHPPAARRRCQAERDGGGDEHAAGEGHRCRSRRNPGRLVCRNLHRREQRQQAPLPSRPADQRRNEERSRPDHGSERRRLPERHVSTSMSVSFRLRGARLWTEGAGSGGPSSTRARSRGKGAISGPATSERNRR